MSKIDDLIQEAIDTLENTEDLSALDSALLKDIWTKDHLACLVIDQNKAIEKVLKLLESM